MNVLLRSSLVALVLSLLAACSSGTSETKTSQPPVAQPETEPEQPNPEPEQPSEPEPKPAPKPDILGNNSAVLSGPELGTGTTDISVLRKEVPVTLQAPNSSLELGASAYVVRNRASSTAPYWIFSMRNTGDQAHCFINLENITVRGEDKVLLEEDFDYIYGSVGELREDLWTDSCLDAGEQGYFINLDADLVYEDVSSFSVETIASYTETIKEPSTTVKPKSYSIDGSDISLNVQNEGGGASELGSAMYILLDSETKPLIWSFAFEDSDNPILNAGETRLLTAYEFYSGSASQMYVNVDFDPPSANSGAEASKLQTLSAGDRLEQRDLQERAKLERLQTR